MNEINGLIHFYGLQDWWIKSFTSDERVYIIEKYHPMGSSGNNFTEGDISSNQEISLFLFGLSTWFRMHEERRIAQIIHQKIVTAQATMVA